MSAADAFAEFREDLTVDELRAHLTVRLQEMHNRLRNLVSTVAGRCERPYRVAFGSSAKVRRAMRVCDARLRCGATIAYCSESHDARSVASHTTSTARRGPRQERAAFAQPCTVIRVKLERMGAGLRRQACTSRTSCKRTAYSSSLS